MAKVSDTDTRWVVIPADVVEMEISDRAFRAYCLMASYEDRGDPYIGVEGIAELLVTDKAEILACIDELLDKGVLTAIEQAPEVEVVE